MPSERAANPGWTALVLAGQRPGVDPLAAAFGETYKALIPIDGAPMLARVVATLEDTPQIARIVVLAQEPDALRHAVPPSPRLRWAAGGAGISRSILAVAGGEAAPWPILLTTADHPLLTRAMIGDFLAGVGDADVAVAMVERAAMLARYPATKRTWLRFRGGAWSGANLFALTGPNAARALELWAAAEQDRKQAFKLFRHFGLALALRAITRTITLPDALARAGAALRVKARLVPLPQAEAAIDVDKPADHALAEAILRAGRAG